MSSLLLFKKSDKPDGQADSESAVSGPSTTRSSSIELKRLPSLSDAEKGRRSSFSATLVKHAGGEDEFPEGGMQAWLTVAGSFLIQYCTFGYISAFGVYQDYYVRVYLRGYTPSQIGWIGGVLIFLNFGLGAPAGLLFDKGYFRYLMFIAILLHALATFMLSLSHAGQYYQVFLTNGAALGLSCGLIYVPSLGIVTHYFQRRRTIAIGVVSSGSALGAVLHPIMLNHLIKLKSIGFHNAVRISGGLNVTLLLVAFAVMRTRLGPKPRQKFPVLSWLREPVYACSLLAGMCAFLGLFFPIFYLQFYALTRGIDQDLAFYILPILNAASVIGRLVPNALAHKTGTANLVVPIALITGIVCCTLSTANTLGGILAVAILWGFSSGAVISLVPAAVGLTAKEPSETGTRLGIFFAAASIFGLFAQPISGALLTDSYKWLPASLLAGIAMIAASLFYSVARMLLARQKGTQIV